MTSNHQIYVVHLCITYLFKYSIENVRKENGETGANQHAQNAHRGKENVLVTFRSQASQHCRRFFAFCLFQHLVAIRIFKTSIRNFLIFTFKCALDLTS